MTHVLLISAAPTPWDAEGRLGGNPMLPLSADGESVLRARIASLTDPVDAIYTYTNSLACDQAARLVAHHFKLRVRDSEFLEPISMGLWQGLTRDELRFRYPTVFPQWEENPLNVNPPEGESLEAAADRFRQGMRKILKRNRGGTVALVLRPISLQLVAGILRGQDLPAIVKHLHQTPEMETIDVNDD
jgi:broad specificity phosphatase PhoE